MKTPLIYRSVEDLVNIAFIDIDCLAWVHEMQGGMLLDAGPDGDTILLHASEKVRQEAFSAAAGSALFDTGELHNLIFAFGRKATTDLLLHVKREGEGWRLRLVYCAKEGYAFCPLEGYIPCDGSGIKVEVTPWALADGVAEDGQQALILMDYAMTAFTRIKGYSRRRLMSRILPLDMTLPAVDEVNSPLVAEDEIAAALGCTVEEVRARAEAEGWPYLRVGEENEPATAIIPARPH